MKLELDFKSPRAQDAHIMEPFFSMRPNRACDSGLLDTFIWRDRYDVRCCIADEKAVLTVMGGEHPSAMLPWCSEEDLPYYFELLMAYFNEKLNSPLIVYSADEEGLRTLELEKDERFMVEEMTDYRDYLYDGELLRTLAGKKYHNKKNLVNKFCRQYEGRWEYRTIGCEERELVLEFLSRWFIQHADQADADMEYEHRGIEEILHESCILNYKMGGIFIDGILQAVSMGTLNPRENMAVISVEKANPDFAGIYQVINREFLLHEFPTAQIINREDDMGHPGLRQAKESYHPVDFARKYVIIQKDFKSADAAFSSGTDTEAYND